MDSSRKKLKLRKVWWKLNEGGGAWNDILGNKEHPSLT